MSTSLGFLDTDIETEIKELSVKSIKTLLKRKNTKEDKKVEVIDAIQSKQTLSPEEEIFLKTLPTKDILTLLNSSDKKEDKE